MLETINKVLSNICLLYAGCQLLEWNEKYVDWVRSGNSKMALP